MNFYFTNPTTTMEARRNMMKRMIEDIGTVQPVRSIPMDLRSNENEYIVTAYLPGLPSEAVNIQYNNGTLSIDGEYPEQSFEGLQTHLNELPVGKFSRSIEFADPIAADKIDADLKDGILTLHLPKAEEAKPKLIKIKSK